MSADSKGLPTGKESMEIAEEAREEKWAHPSFVAELFKGNFRSDLIFPFPEQPEADKKIGDEFLAKLEKFALEKIDSNEIDRTGEVPKDVLDGLKEMGAFGMKIDQKYGGLGLSHTNYVRALALLGGHDGNISAWLSAHQSIGVPQPLKLFGTEEQKKKYLPRCVREVSAFALTEVGVGSDPAGMTMRAEPSPDGNSWILNGQKLWCTNGAVADILVVMARTPDVVVKGKPKKQISAFIVEKTMPGFRVVHRCRFMGLHGIQNALLEFKDVKVPKENLIGEPGQGLKIALTTLNTGRLSLPALCVGLSKKCLEIMRHWTKDREQWGTKIGNHEEIAVKNSLVATGTFAIGAVTFWTAAIVDRGGQDIRLEAAMAKLFCTELNWKIVQETLQARGGRGYENALSLKARGEPPVPVERALRDIRVNTILEGSTEIMHLFIAREALDFHMQLAKDLLDPKTPMGKKVTAFFKVAFAYATWYPRQWIYLTPRFGKFDGTLAHHLRYVARTSKRLARSVFHALLRYRLALERRELVLARLVEVGTELFAMALSCARAQSLLSKKPEDRAALELADVYCREATRRIESLFASESDNDDHKISLISKGVMQGRYQWLEEGTLQGNIPW